MSSYNGFKQQEGHVYMFVKVLRVIPYYGDSRKAGVDVPDDGNTYFEVISNHFLKGMILKMNSLDFKRRFTEERARTDPNMNAQYKSTIFSSGDWLFYEKLKWWNNNIKGIIDCSSRDSIEFATLYNDYINEYCNKFKVDFKTTIDDKIFFDDLLSEIYIDSNGKIQSKKERVGKPKKRKYCSACGNSVKYYVTLPNKKILCKMCEEQMESYKYLKFEKQWEE